MSVNYNGKLDASITNDINDKNILQQVYVSIVAKKSGTNQEFAFTVLKENDAASPGFIGTLVVNPKDFDFVKKAYNLDCKFEDFPNLVAGVVDKLKESSHLQLHIAEDTCRVIFHVEDVHFELNINLYLDGLADYVVKNALKIANDFHTPDVEPKKALVLELKKTPAEGENVGRAENIECSDEIKEDGKTANPSLNTIPLDLWICLFKYISRDDLEICMHVCDLWNHIIVDGTKRNELKQRRVVSLKHGYSPSRRFMIDFTSQHGKKISMIEGAGLLNPKHIFKNSIVEKMSESFRLDGEKLEDRLVKINKLICDRIIVKSFHLCFAGLDAFGCVEADELTIRGIHHNVLFNQESWKYLDFEADMDAFRESINLDKFFKYFLFGFGYSESLVEELRCNFEQNDFKLIDNELDHLETSTFRLAHSKLNWALEAIICKDYGSPYLNVTFKMVEL
uniref:F-box domain-containing protein n=1 Tax=Acrobeloides nanus TaxID=290746 RepID=A0A914DSX3_9BILA